MAKKLSKKDYENMIKTLRGARVYINEHRYKFVCTAITEYANHNRIKQDIKVYLRNWVQSMLGKYENGESIQTLENWYSANNITFDKQSIRNSRLEWIDWMIDQLESETIYQQYKTQKSFIDFLKGLW